MTAQTATLDRQAGPLQPGSLLAITTTDPDDYRRLPDGTLEYLGLVHAATVGVGIRCEAGRWSREFRWEPGGRRQVTCPDCLEALSRDVEVLDA